MKKSLINHIGFKALIVTLALMFFASPAAKSAYCTPTNTSYSLGYNMRINLFQFDGNTILKWDATRDSKGNLSFPATTNPANTSSPYWRGVDSKNPVIKAKAGKDYDIRCWGGASTLSSGSVKPEDVAPSGSYAQDFAIYIDLDQDGTFATSERVGYSFSGSFERSFKVSIPQGAKGGLTTLRLVCDYGGFSGTNIGPCKTYYGETRDFAIIIGGVDCGITKISSPSSPLSVGTQPVKAILKNYSEGDVLKSCIIDWTVDGVKQTAVNWTGSLAVGQETEVTLGNYNFASKGNLTIYNLTATTSKPNNEDDANAVNDASPTLTLAMPLPAQTYYVGGTGYDFATLKEFTNILFLAGIKNDGEVRVRIRPGTYTGPFTLDNFPHKNNTFIFESDPAFNGNVITTAPSTSLNYVWYLNNTQNVTFKGITFEVTDPSSLGGRIFMIRGNVDNLAFDNNTFNGLNTVGASPTYTLVDCQASQMNNVRYFKNIFNNGDRSLSIVNTLRNSKGLVVEQNTFNSALNYGIYVENIGDGNILNNAVKGSSRASLGGIYVKNGTTITNNSITGVVGASTSAAGITIVDDNLAVSAVVTGNKITGCQGITGISGTGLPGGTIINNTIDLTNKNLNSANSGIYLSNPTLGTSKVIISENNILTENGNGINVVNFPIDILKNRIITDYNGSKVNLSSVSSTGAKGMILSNEIISAGSAFTLTNSTMTTAYNSAMCSGTANALLLNSGDNKIARNHLINLGTGNSFAITALNTNKLDGNNYITTTGILGSIDGTNYGSTTQFATFDKNARSVDPTFKTNTNLKIIEFKDELNFTQPLTNIVWPAGYQALYEETDLAGVFREGKYYIGAYIVLPNLEIIGFSDDLIDCSGTPDRSISVSAATSNGQEPTYQWFKDGLAIQDENTHILSFEPFDYSVSATYTCRVYCPGAGAQLTGTIPVYALTLPSIVEQPKEVVNAVIGKDYSFNVRVHYRGINPPYYKDNFQWFKYDAAKKDSMPLADDSRIAGTGSSDLTIKKLKDTDICKPGDFYYIRIVSECGTVYSDPFVIAKTPEVVFRDHPANTNPCPNADVIFISNAIAPEGFNLTYKWKKDGVDLTNGIKYNGANTNKLQVFGVQLSDEGNYVCVATIPEVPTSKNSNVGILKLKDIPTANAEGQTEITTKRGNNITLHVNLVKGSEPLTAKWTYNGELIKEALWSQYDGEKLLTVLLENVVESQSGEYKCVLENECDKTEIVYNITITKWDEAQSVEVISENGYSLYACAPNPSNGSTKIRFEMPKTDNAVITLIDQSGRTVSTLFSGIANKGLNILDVNTNSLNVSAGMYFYTITTNGFSASMPMVIVK